MFGNSKVTQEINDTSLNYVLENKENHVSQNNMKTYLFIIMFVTATSKNKILHQKINIIPLVALSFKLGKKFIHS